MILFLIIATICFIFSIYTGTQAKKKWKHGELCYRDNIVLCIVFALACIFLLYLAVIIK